MAARHKHHLAGYLDAHKSGQARSQASSGPVRGRQTGGQTSNQKHEEEGVSMRRSAGRGGSVPVMFSSSVRSRASYMASRRKAPTKIVGAANINHLPDELLLEIFAYLGAGDLLMAASVCKRWNPVANDNLLWNGIYEKYGSMQAVKSTDRAERLPSAHFKSLCIKQCSERRNRQAFKMLKRISPFTGLPRDTDKSLKGAGIYYQLCLVDSHQNEHMLTSRDVFYHSMGTSVRWYDLEAPQIRSQKQLRVYSVNPLFFNKAGAAISNSPYQRSLLLTMDFDWTKWLRTNKPLASDDMVNVYTMSHGVLVATWKADGDLAYICIGLHNNQLLHRCLRGTSTQPYDFGIHKVIPDDIDSAYGLHDFQCTVEMRTLRHSIWSQQFNNLACKKDTIGQGYATFPLIRRDFHHDHVILQKKLQFPWKTDAFKGIVENVVWIDVTVLDERSEPFWCISSAVKVAGQMLEENVNFDYTNQDVYCLSYRDERGKLEAQMSQTDDKDYFMTSLDLKLSLDAINQWFGTCYK